MEYVLTTRALRKRYGSYQALNGLDMQVPKGAIYGLVGKNGAGKTTLIRLLCGLQEPTDGTYSLYGVPNWSHAVARERRRIGAVVETPSIYLNLTARDNLLMQYRVLGQPSAKGVDEILKLVGLDHTGRKAARYFSLGMRQRLGIAIALAGDPDLLILDEPINGLDPQGIVQMRELILKLNREHQITVLISSHILDELARLATHFGIIDQGRMVRQISAAELEAACRKRTRLTVTDTRVLSRVLDEFGLEYTIWSDREADVYGAVPVGKLALRLSEQDCEVLSLQERDESLEHYYINLVGGGSHGETAAG